MLGEGSAGLGRQHQLLKSSQSGEDFLGREGLASRQGLLSPLSFPRPSVPSPSPGF